MEKIAEYFGWGTENKWNKSYVSKIISNLKEMGLIKIHTENTQKGKKYVYELGYYEVSADGSIDETLYFDKYFSKFVKKYEKSKSVTHEKKEKSQPVAEKKIEKPQPVQDVRPEIYIQSSFDKEQEFERQADAFFDNGEPFLYTIREKEIAEKRDKIYQ